MIKDWERHKIHFFRIENEKAENITNKVINDKKNLFCKYELEKNITLRLKIRGKTKYIKGFSAIKIEDDIYDIISYLEGLIIDKKENFYLIDVI